jgi:hypothetical protein
VSSVLKDAAPARFFSVAMQRGQPGRHLAIGLWFGVLLYVSLLPARFQETIGLFGVPVLWKELLLPLLVLVLAFLFALQPRTAPPDTGKLPAVLSGLFGYAALSLPWWSAAVGPDTAAMAWTLVPAAAAMWGGYLIVRFQRSSLQHFLSSLTIFMSFIAFVYSAQSFFNLGLRTDATAMPDIGFGIGRVSGPLFGHSYGGALLIPALAFALQERVAGRQRLRNSAVAAVLLVACIGTGSRAALAGLFILVGLSARMLPTTKQRLAFGGTVLVITVMVGLVFSRVSTDRFRSLEDDARTVTYQTSLAAVAGATPFEKVRGQGYASYWRWYLPDARGEGSNRSANYIEQRPAGRTLYHPHSTPLLLVVELGLPGLLAAAWLFFVVWRAGTRAARLGLPVVLFAGLAGSAVSLVTDLLIFKAPVPSLVWWTYLFGAIAQADLAFSRRLKVSANSSSTGHMGDVLDRTYG